MNDSVNMSLSRSQFDILEILATAEKTLSQRNIEEKSGFALGKVNKTLKELTELGYVEDGVITLKGFDALEPYRVKRAVFIAAGFGSRLVPVTLNTPKPLVRVNGKRIIDTLLDAVLDAGIDSIYIVRGYLGEQFDQLLYKYPMIKFLENPIYNEANNISSAVIARYLMQNAYVLESDLVVANPSIIKKYHYQSDVLGIWKERTDDWCFVVDKDNCVTEEKIGGRNCYQMVGIYYINASDGARLSDDLKRAYDEPGGKERYWETVPNQFCRGRYRIEVRPCKEADIVEIDTFRELKAIDKTYDV
ncbi:MAG: NTP transferase domain-containing protein [Sphaerochaetaceae bacterium]|nr:NTP transferase domain-containing protein [Sphaerochaetaceae bacterium]